MPLPPADGLPLLPAYGRTAAVGSRIGARHGAPADDDCAASERIQIARSWFASPATPTALTSTFPLLNRDSGHLLDTEFAFSGQKVGARRHDVAMMKT